jgi:hypothetical protein
MKYPIGIQDFKTIRTDGYFYADKSALMYKLIKSGQNYFLSRPRRFGKSLLVSMMDYYFKGERELFKGLAIDQLEKDWATYPVLHLDLNAAKYTTSEALTSILESQLSRWEEVYGASPTEKVVSERFKGVIQRAYEKTGQKVAILVDEYNKPLLQAFGNAELMEDYRATLKAFYGVEKSMGAYIQFAFFTGVTKFSKVSVFSDLNNLADISMDKRYAEICGITEKEIHDNLDAEVESLAQANNLTKEECYDKLKLNYDGYHFEAGTVGMYNPFSLLRTLDSQAFKDYWFETGTPTILVEALRKTNYNLEELTQEEVTADLLGSIDSIETNPLPLIYQSGYLTVKDYDEEFQSYHLGFPNLEVERGFTRFLIPYYTSLTPQQSSSFIANFVKEVRTGQAEQFMQRLDSLFANGDYQIAGDAELYFQNAVWVIFKLVGLYTEVEHHTTNGRIDMLIKTQDYIYIIEFKLDNSADDALRQIEEKQYAKPFEHDGRTIYKIGVNFSSQTRRIDDWKIK